MEAGSVLDIVKLRRDFHQYPELGFTEFRTAAIVVEYLREYGYDVLFGKDTLDGPSCLGMPDENVIEDAFNRAIQHGANPDIVENMRGGYTAVVGTLKGKESGPTVAFRFDMDALPIQESSEAYHFPQKEGFGSTFDQCMHACGHDGHTAIGLGLAERLSDRAFKGTVKLIFQPAEEGGRGAVAMVEKGMLDDIDYFFSQHLGTDAALGEFRGGSEGFLASTKMIAHFYGKASHAGAAPEKGRNALMSAATALLNIHSMPRFSSEKTRVNVGVLEGGKAANIIPEYARMVIETRAESNEVNTDIERRVRLIIEHSAQMQDVKHRIEKIGTTIPILCDDELVELAVEEARHIKFFTTIKGIKTTTAGSEDASFMIRRVQELGGKGTYMIIGCDIPAPHHNPEFDIQEEVLVPSVDLLHRITNRLLN